MSQASAPVPVTTALVQEANRRFLTSGPEAILGWGFDTFPRDRVALCTSLQHEGMVLLDIAHRLRPDLLVFTIDSGRLPEETLDLVEAVRERYGVDIEVLYPDAAEVGNMVSQHGPNLFLTSPELRLACCEVRKVRPLQRRLACLDAWISGLRRQQNATRAAVDPVQVDAVHGGIVKLNPLAGWSEAEVLEYVVQHRLPRNALYDRGYTSIGCAPCTRPTEPGEDPRAGRWWWEQGVRECGIHYNLAVDGVGTTRVATERNPAPEVEDA